MAQNISTVIFPWWCLRPWIYIPAPLRVNPAESFWNCTLWVGRRGLEYNHPSNLTESLWGRQGSWAAPYSFQPRTVHCSPWLLWSSRLTLQSSPRSSTWSSAWTPEIRPGSCWGRGATSHRSAMPHKDRCSQPCLGDGLCRGHCLCRILCPTAEGRAAWAVTPLHHLFHFRNPSPFPVLSQAPWLKFTFPLMQTWAMLCAISTSSTLPEQCKFRVQGS